MKKTHTTASTQSRPFRSGPAWRSILLLATAPVLIGSLDAKPAWGANCLECHSARAGKFQMVGNDTTADPGSGNFKVYQVEAGQTATIQLQVTDGGGKYGLSVFGKSANGVNDAGHQLSIPTPGTPWVSSTDYYYTATTSANGTFTLNVAVDAATPADYYPFESQIGIDSGGRIGQAENFYIQVLSAAPVNRVPLLADLAPQTLDEGSTLSVTAVGTDDDVPVQTLTYSLGAAAPAGMSIDASSGAISWATTEADGPGSVTVEVTVTDDGTPAMSATKTLSVTVNEVNVAPLLAAITPAPVSPGATVTFTANGSDTDLPAQMLTYSLGAGAPAGATLDPSSGAFSWTVPSDAAAGTTTFDVTVTDDGTPALAATESVSVVVTDTPNPAPQLEIAWVSFHTADDAPSAAAVTAGFTEAPDIGYTQLLRDNGHNVTRIRTSGTPNVAALNNYDLVIVGRSVPSGDYQDPPETAAWNSVTAPTILMGGYIVRSSRLGFTVGTTIPDTTNAVSLTLTEPTHPIFAGIALDGNNTMVNEFAGIATFTNAPQRGISVNTDAAVAGGTVLATVATADPTVGGMIVGEFPAGTSVGAGRDTLAGHRLVFLSGSREGSGLTSEGAGIFDLAADGAQMFLNAVGYMAEPKIRVRAPVIEGSDITVTWSNGGTLEYGPTVNGPWTSTEDSSGSYTEALPEGDRFYRVVEPTP